MYVRTSGFEQWLDDLGVEYTRASNTIAVFPTSSISAGAIAGIVIAILIVIVALIVLVRFSVRRKRFGAGEGAAPTHVITDPGPGGLPIDAPVIVPPPPSVPFGVPPGISTVTDASYSRMQDTSTGFTDPSLSGTYRPILNYGSASYVPAQHSVEYKTAATDPAEDTTKALHWEENGVGLSAMLQLDQNSSVTGEAGNAIGMSPPTGVTPIPVSHDESLHSTAGWPPAPPQAPFNGAASEQEDVTPSSPGGLNRSN